MNERLCACHGEPMYRYVEPRNRSGETWTCAVKKRASARRVDQARRGAKAQQQRDRYDADPIYRLSKLLEKARNQRAATLKRRRERG